MPRSIPRGRFDDLVRAATEVFIARGFKRTQMSEIADAVGVSKPTLYLYVESKEALFALCCRHADRQDMLELPESLPVRLLRAESPVEELRKRLEARAALPTLAAALARPRASDIGEELRDILHELYAVVEANCRTLKLLDRCWDHPDFGPAWHEQGRVAPRVQLRDYIDSRMRAGQIRAQGEPRLLARIALETVVTWAMHIKWDRSPEPFEPISTRESVVEFVVRGLIGEAPATASDSPNAPRSSTGDPT